MVRGSYERTLVPLGALKGSMGRTMLVLKFTLQCQIKMRLIGGPANPGTGNFELRHTGSAMKETLNRHRDIESAFY